MSPNRRRRPLPKIRRAGPIRPPKAAEMAARKRLLRLLASIEQDVVKAAELALAGEAGPERLAEILRGILDRWRDAGEAAAIARDWTGEIDRLARERLQERLANALGVDMTRIFDDLTVRTAAAAAAEETANLITKMTEDYLGRVANAALQNYRQIPFPEGRSLVQEIQHQTGMAFTRARTIARHQTSVINGTVNRARQASVGIEEYYWESADDERVVGRPGGTYPKGNAVHGDHWKRDWRHNGGKSRRWDEPYATGGAFPGEAVNCRCVALPKIELDKLTEKVLA
jgi:uncharacterized protein with gpF-like domain